MNELIGFLRSLGPARLAAMGAVALALVGFFTFLILRFNEVSESALYTGLSIEDSAAIVKELEAAAVPFSLRQGGATIMVPDADADRLRMSLAEEGLPSGGGVGYEIFDKTDGLGTTSFVQNVNHLRALEGELARTIRTIRRVEAARVHLVLPERQLFRREAATPTASIVLKTRGGLEPGQIRAIQHLVAAAVPELEPGRVSIVDETGRLLAQGAGEDLATGLATAVDERTAAVQGEVEERVRDIVESVVGAGRARVRVAAELDLNRISETRDTFDPEGQVVRSLQTREEESDSRDSPDQVTAGNQIPNAAQPPAESGARDSSRTTEETTNYEISKTTRTEVKEIGGIKRLSVAVLVDGRYATGADGVQTYTPRPQPELDSIAALVRTAMGYDQERGDQIEVVNLQFADGPKIETDLGDPGLLEFSREDVMRLAEMGVMLALTLLVLLFAVRPLVRRILDPDGTADFQSLKGDAQPGETFVAPNGVSMVIGPDGIARAVELGPDGKPLAQLEGPDSKGRIDEAKAAGQLQLDQIRRVGEIVADSHNEATILIRTWLSEAA